MRDPFSGKGTLGVPVGAAPPHARIDDFTYSRSQPLSSAIASEPRAYSSSQARLVTEQHAIPGSYHRLPAAPPIGGALKRMTDILIAVTALALLSPAMLIIFGLIRFTSDGPAIFAHRRIGHNGRSFKCYKFRTMAFDAEEALIAHLANNTAAAEEWRQYRKLRRDPRITSLGHFLRKSSLDELPQLFNVLRGDMSCVGPRPIPSEELIQYGDAADEYLRARPGLTGIWQISGRNKLDYTSRVALDCYYIRNWSFWRDIVILSKTLVVVVNFDETS